jgi:hypothetical protein
MLWFAGSMGALCGIWVLVVVADVWGEFTQRQAALGKEWAIDKLVSDKLLNEHSKEQFESDQAAKELVESTKQEQRAEAHARADAKLEARRAKS